MYSQAGCEKFKDNYIPKNLNEALSYFDCKWSEKDKDAFMIGYTVSFEGNIPRFYMLLPFNKNPDCYLTGIVKEKRKKNFTLSLKIIDLDGYKNAYLNLRNVVIKIGKTYHGFGLQSNKILKHSPVLSDLCPK